MIGYKAFNNDWTCRGFQYKIGETYRMNEIPKCCMEGFHFCKKISDCFSYYRFSPDNKYALVESRGAVVTNDERKYATNALKIIKEISWAEVLDMVNTGKGNTGLDNTGHLNSGNRNTGSKNTGKQNSGNQNGGNYNTGNQNDGDSNTGDYNSGYWNAGHHNTGRSNTGNWNSGDWNSGSDNSGRFNTGRFNSGNWNTGAWNRGHHNSGDWNNGNHNTGDWNSGNWNSGCFNTEDGVFFMFNKPCSWTYGMWYNSGARFILNQCPKNNNRRQDWYDHLAEQHKAIIKLLPNFDAGIFKQITGIDVNKEC